MNKKLFMILTVILLITIDMLGIFSYLQRSLLKILLFGIVPLLSLKHRNMPFPNLKKGVNLKGIVLLSVIIIVGLLGGAYLLSYFGLFDNVQVSLANQVGVVKSNYPYVFVYVVLINGPLEEFFFRHYVYIQDFKYRKFVSSLLFSIYHVGMLFTMFPWYLFVLLIGGLMLVGYFFLMINTRKHSLLNSILVHMAANFAINLVGWVIVMQA
jgi:membrane protease YdiL (CAAX protease family)